MTELRDPSACYECDKRTPPPRLKKVIKVCDDPAQPDICYFITVKVHEECMH